MRLDETLTRLLDAARDERPDLSLLSRSGAPVPLASEHCRLLADIVATEQPDDCGTEQVAALGDDGRIMTVDQGVGAWIITAHRDDAASWLTITSPDGTDIAQRDTGITDPAAVAVGMYVVWGWAVIGPEVF